MHTQTAHKITKKNKLYAKSGCNFVFVTEIRENRVV